MRIEMFEMERMQSTWENLVDYDMSESGIRPLTLRELVAMGFDLETSWTPARLQPVERHDRAARADRGHLCRRDCRSHRGDQRHLRSQLPDRAQPDRSGRRGGDAGAELHADVGCARAVSGADVVRFVCAADAGWEPDWDEFERAVTPKTRLVYLSNPNNPTGAVLSRNAMQRIVERCEQTGTWLLSDEVYLGAEIHDARDTKLLGHERSRHGDQRAVEGIRDSRRAHRMDRRPPQVVAECWTQHDYITIGPNKISDRSRAWPWRPRIGRPAMPHGRDSAAQSADRAGLGQRFGDG